MIGRPFGARTHPYPESTAEAGEKSGLAHLRVVILAFSQELPPSGRWAVWNCMHRNRLLQRIDFGKRGVASRYLSARRRTGLATDGSLRGSSPIRAALRWFSSRTRSEKPHRNPSADGSLCATCFIPRRSDAEEHQSRASSLPALTATWQGGVSRDRKFSESIERMH